MRIYPALGFVLLLMVALLPARMPPVTQAQSECLAAISEAFSTMAAGCAGSPGGSACFGHGAHADLAPGADAADRFEEAGDVMSLAGVQSIRTQPPDPANGEWGLAVMNVHANVPLSASERGLVYVLIGDVEVENAVPLESAVTPAQPVTVTALVAANIRSAPNTDARIVGNAPAGSSHQADGVSSDRGWLRIMHETDTAWISRQVLAIPEGAVDSLPVVGAGARTLMQSFYLRTGGDHPECSGAPPSMLVIQAPQGLTANFTVNGIDIRIASTIALRVLPDNNLQLIALDGGAYSGSVSIPAGLTMTIPLSADGRSPAGFWTGQRAISDEERSFLLALEQVAPDAWHYAIHIPTQAEIAALLGQLRGAGGGTGARGPAAGQADCSRFRPTSPLDGMAFGSTTFYWDGAPGATQYRLNILSAGGSVVRTVEIPAQNTSVSTDTGGGLGDGNVFTWYVEALVNGQLACASQQVTIPRASGVLPVGAGGGGAEATPTACPWASC
jgi:hypothetical protein